MEKLEQGHCPIVRRWDAEPVSQKRARETASETIFITNQTEKHIVF